jgi:hypothetical protein
MKTFIKENWFKLVLSVCFLICSIAFLVQSSKPVKAVGGVDNVIGCAVYNGKLYAVYFKGSGLGYGKVEVD